jgi:predicted RNA-binding Zn-ribbon protein involved in translation (DUF1610 family)
MNEDTFKFSCPTCGQRISTTRSAAGTGAVCPLCGDDLVVPKPSVVPRCASRRGIHIFFSCAVVAILFAMAGVYLSSERNVSSSEPALNIKDEDYFPLREGDEWLSDGVTSKLFEKSTDLVEHRLLCEIAEQGGQKFRRERIYFDEALKPFCRLWRIDGSGVYSISEGKNFSKEVKVFLSP